MEPIQNHLETALAGLSTPVETPPHNTAIDRYFSDWSITGQEATEELRSLNALLDAAKAWCSAYTAAGEPYWLVMSGNSGCGKTFLAECIRAFLKDWGSEIYGTKVLPIVDPKRGNVDCIWSYRQSGPFMRKWTKSINAIRGGNYQRVEELSGDYVKIIDDFGAESMDREGRPTPFVIGKMGEICDGRLNKWTVITMNFSEKEIAELFDARIASRIGRNLNVYQRCKARDFNVRKQAKLKSAA